ncbi:hypothetical protein HLK59_38315 [Streptomyces sp. S3(2020)]|uniref:hypothetical protein n=1 Tax=Streptomyces sp. S3(2020) TaxID=2732044 RepID=UPI001489279E|nr:hypothetical protein [Streptomyces sp. S3(2020)]NNN36119.1 hypothetical protein [Streptomyces sp. S3(2020)]
MNTTNDPDDFTAADARAVLAGLGVDTRLGVGEDGRPTVHTDRAGLVRLRDTASAYGATAIAAAIDIALAEGEAS